MCHVETDNETDHNLILKSRLYTVRHFNFQTDESTLYKYIPAQNNLSTVCCIERILTSCLLMNENLIFNIKKISGELNIAC